jgi:hypothetical protein
MSQAANLEVECGLRSFDQVSGFVSSSQGGALSVVDALMTPAQESTTPLLRQNGCTFVGLMQKKQANFPFLWQTRWYYANCL